MDLSTTMLNSTDIEYLYFSINTALNVILFVTIALPAISLLLLCVLALLFAEGINWPIRVILVNVFVADLCIWTAVSVLLLGYPVREGEHGGGYFSCSAFTSLVFVGSVQEISGVALYAVTVFIFLKRGVHKLKWCYIVLYMVLSWALLAIVSAMPYFDAFGDYEVNGFCGIRRTPLFNGFIYVIQALIIIFYFIIFLFSLLAYLHVRRHPLQGSIPMKKITLKYLVYLDIALFFSFITYVVPNAFPSIRASGSPDDTENLLGLTLVKVVRVILQLPSIITPIAAIVIIKPLRAALKKGLKKCTQSVTDEGFNYSDELMENQ